MDEDFDLFGDRNDSAVGGANADEHKDESVLVWHRLDETKGYQPSLKEGHTSLSYDSKVLVFGGFEAGKRVNTLLSLDVPTCNWSVVKCTGDIPPVRNQHAATLIEDQGLMIIHGGESERETSPKMVSAESLPNLNPNQLADNFQQGSHTLNQGSSLISNLENPLPGVCPSDSLIPYKTVSYTPLKVAHGSDAAKRNSLHVQEMLSDPANLPASVCLDDLYTYDIASKTWREIPTILAPLPRKGHSLNVLSVQGEKQLLLFGGYSVEKATISNSLHICTLSSIIQAHHSLDAPSSSTQSSGYVEKIKALRSPKANTKTVTINTDTNSNNSNNDNFFSMNNKPVWRMLECSGQVPEPRYRHSSTLTTNGYLEEMLVVIGGIGRDPIHPLSDVHVLNAVTLQWSTLREQTDTISRGLSSSAIGPVQGLYGHCAFVVKKAPLDKKKRKQKKSGNKAPASSSEYDIIVFGGSADIAHPYSQCYQRLFLFNLTDNVWQGIDTGYNYPGARFNHSVALIRAKFSNNLPTPAVKVKHQVPIKDLSSNVLGKGLVLSMEDCSHTEGLRMTSIFSAPQTPVPSSAPSPLHQSDTLQKRLLERNQQLALAAAAAASLSNTVPSSYKVTPNVSNKQQSISMGQFKSASTSASHNTLINSNTNSCATVTFANPNNPDDDNYSFCAIVFGGRCSAAKSMPRPDTWALDLEWQPSGLDQYDQSFHCQTRNQVLAREESDQSLRQTQTQAQHRQTHKQPKTDSTLTHPPAHTNDSTTAVGTADFVDCGQVLPSQEHSLPQSILPISNKPQYSSYSSQKNSANQHTSSSSRLSKSSDQRSNSSRRHGDGIGSTKKHANDKKYLNDNSKQTSIAKQLQKTLTKEIQQQREELDRLQRKDEAGGGTEGFLCADLSIQNPRKIFDETNARPAVSTPADAAINTTSQPPGYNQTLNPTLNNSFDSWDLSVGPAHTNTGDESDLNLNPWNAKAIARAFIKAKTERAQADLLYKKEKQSLGMAQDEITRQAQEIEGLKNLYMGATERYENTISDLRLQLEQSKKEKQQLKRLNEDCYQLVLLNRVENL